MASVFTASIQGKTAGVAGAALFVLAALSAMAQSPSAGTWSAGADMPGPRTEPGAAALDGKLYVLGGSTRDIDDLATALVYDPEANAWRAIASMPRGINHVGSAALNGRVYAIGGFTGKAPGENGPRKVHFGAVDVAFEYDPAANAWKTLPPMSSPRGSVGVAALDGKIHAIGGRGLDIKTVATHEIYDPSAGAWTRAAPLPTKRDHMATISARGLIHVIGGRLDDRDDNVGLHDIYDPRADTWRSGPPLPTPRSGGQSALVGGLIVVYGGENSKKTFDEVEAFDLDANAWISYARAPTGLHASAGAAIGDAVYFPGGSTGPGGDAITAGLRAFRPR